MATKRSTSAFPADDEFPNVGGIEADGAADLDEFDFSLFLETADLCDGYPEVIRQLFFIPKDGHG